MREMTQNEIRAHILRSDRHPLWRIISHENILPGNSPVVAGMFRNQPESFDEPRTIKQFIFQRFNGAARRNRTSDPALTKGVLYL